MSVYNKLVKRSFSNVSKILKPIDNKSSSILSKYYSNELLNSISLAEKVFPNNNNEIINNKYSKFGPQYLDDFSKLDPYWDYKPGLSNIHFNEINNSSNKILINDWNNQQQPIPKDSLKPNSSLNQIRSTFSNDLAKQTGLNAKLISQLTMRPIVMKYVSNQTAKGKIRSCFAIVATGNKNGILGLGQGHSRTEMSVAIHKAYWDSIKNLSSIPRYENRTILSDLNSRFHGSRIFMRKGKPGLGLRCHHVIFELCQLAGIKDLSCKVYGSRNVMNVAKGFYETLKNQKTIDEIAIGRGRKITDVTRVYYSE